MASMPGNLLEHKRAEMGMYGHDYIADTNTHTGAWCEVRVVVAATFTTNTILNGAAEGFGTPTEQPVGTVIKGYFTAIDLSGGEVMALRCPAV